MGRENVKSANSGRALLAAIMTVCIGVSGCVRSRPAEQTITEQVRALAAKVLNKDAEQIDITKPLATMGADDLDCVELVMEVEEAFGVELPDDALVDDAGNASKTLTVEKLAQIVSKQLESRHGSSRPQSYGK